MAAIPSSPRLEAPAALVVETFDEGTDSYALISWPLRKRRPATPTVLGDPAARLPRAQREVLELLLAGLSNGDIARRRLRSARTVAHQIETLFRKLGIGSRAELFALAARHGWTGAKP
jgi:DNA-binding NarL/FixJ family response regulator